MSDGTQQGIGVNRALETIMGGKEPPQESEEKSPQFWLERLINKDDNIDGYDAHAEVMAKYIVQAYKKYPALTGAPNSTVCLEPINWENPIILMPNLSDCLKKVYSDEKHPFRQALSEATGFTWGWAFNIARYALGLPPQPNPAILTIG